MDPAPLAAWVIVLTFFSTFAYLILSERGKAPLALAACFSRAALLCFCGLLFAAAVNHLAVRAALPLEDPLTVALLVPLGCLLALLLRRHWRTRTVRRRNNS